MDFQKISTIKCCTFLTIYFFISARREEGLGKGESEDFGWDPGREEKEEVSRTGQCVCLRARRSFRTGYLVVCNPIWVEHGEEEMPREEKKRRRFDRCRQPSWHSRLRPFHSSITQEEEALRRGPTKSIRSQRAGEQLRRSFGGCVRSRVVCSFDC